MEVEDLKTFPPGHPPSPWPLPVIDRRGPKHRYAVLPPNLSMRAVGWLGAEVPTTGATPPECIDRLVQAMDSEEVIQEGMRGIHSCEVCQSLGTSFPGSEEFWQQFLREHRVPVTPESVRAQVGSRPVIVWRQKEYAVLAAGHHVIQHGLVVYVCPQLILHYILHHEYRPPNEFIEAVTHGHFLTFEDLAILPEGGEKEWFDRVRARGRL